MGLCPAEIVVRQEMAKAQERTNGVVLVQMSLGSQWSGISIITSTSLPIGSSAASALACFRPAIPRVMACFPGPDEVSAGYDSGKLLSKALYSRAALQSKAATMGVGSSTDPQGVHENYY